MVLLIDKRDDNKIKKFYLVSENVILKIYYPVQSRTPHLNSSFHSQSNVENIMMIIQGKFDNMASTLYNNSLSILLGLHVALAVLHIASVNYML